VSEHNIDMIDAEPLQTIFERTPDAVCRVVKHDIVGGIAVRKQLFGVVMWRGLQQLSDLGGDQITVARLLVQEHTVSAFGEA
jgi:hypothetical protein